MGGDETTKESILQTLFGAQRKSVEIKKGIKPEVDDGIRLL